MEYKDAAEGSGASVITEGQKKSSSTGLAVGATVFEVGMGEIVGRGEIVGAVVGLAEGAGETVGPELGDTVGLGVT